MKEGIKSGCTTLSLCLIVKNGAEYLQQCLASVQSVVSEMIVVDTGSTDDTLEMAQKFGAVVRHFLWIDDFSAARNFSLSLASGDWILVLDADEELDPLSRPDIGRIINQTDSDIYYVNILSQRTVDGYQSNFMNSLPRLFRNSVGIQFEGRIHEQILPSAQRLSLRVANSNIKIIHHGYDGDQQKQSQKLQRNLFLLKKELAENPGNSFARFHLGETLTLLKGFPAAVSAYQSALENSLPEHLIPIVYQNLGNVYLKLEQYQQTLKQCEKAIQLKPGLFMAYIFSALAYKKMGDTQKVVKKLEKIVDLVNKNDTSNHIKYETIPDMAYVFTLLGHGYAELKKNQQALESYQFAIKHGSRFYDTYSGMGDLLFAQNQYRLSLNHYQQAFRLGARDNSIYIKLMKCYFEIGNLVKAMEMIEPLVKRKVQITVENRYQSILNILR